MSWFSAPPPAQRWAYALTAIVTATAVPAHAQTAAPQTNADDANAPVTVQAEEITGRPDREVNLSRNVELTRGQTRLTADTACFQQVEDQVTAQRQRLHVALRRPLHRRRAAAEPQSRARATCSTRPTSWR